MELNCSFLLELNINMLYCDCPHSFRKARGYKLYIEILGTLSKKNH